MSCSHVRAAPPDSGAVPVVVVLRRDRIDSALRGIDYDASTTFFGSTDAVAFMASCANRSWSAVCGRAWLARNGAQWCGR